MYPLILLAGLIPFISVFSSKTLFTLLMWITKGLADKADKMHPWNKIVCSCVSPSLNTYMCLCAYSLKIFMHFSSTSWPLETLKLP